MHINTAADLFVEHLGENRTLSTQSLICYTQDAYHAADFLESIGAKDTTKIKESHLDQYRDYFLDGGHSLHTANRRFRTLSKVFDYLVEEGKQERNPLKGYKWPKAHSVKRRAGATVTKEMIDAIRDRDAVSLRDRAIMEVMLATGANAKSVVEIGQNDLDTEAGTIRVGPEVRKLPASALRAIEAYMDARDEQIRWKAPGSTKKTPLPRNALWVSFARRSRGRQLAVRSIYDILKERQLVA